MSRMSPQDYALSVLEKVKAKEREKNTIRMPLDEYPIDIVQILCEIFTGKAFRAKPDKIYLPEAEEPICLVLSSKKTHYYRVTPTNCTCKGWKYSWEKYGVGKCRHHTLAFPVKAKENLALIENIENPSIKPKFDTPFRPFVD